MRKRLRFPRTAGIDRLKGAWRSSEGFPVHAGIDPPYADYPVAGLSGFPRTRGDRPRSALLTLRAYGFPVHAGIDLTW